MAEIFRKINAPDAGKPEAGSLITGSAGIMRKVPCKTGIKGSFFAGSGIYNDHSGKLEQGRSQAIFREERGAAAEAGD